jgi:hypothetical protein
MDRFGETYFLYDLNQYVDNASVTGFFIEQAVLSSIAAHGLNIGQNICTKITTDMFETDFPVFKKDESSPVLHCPLHYNYPGIDGIIVRFDNSGGQKTCFMFPLQITMAKRHSNSEQVFFSKWKPWTEHLEDYKIVLRFLWISEDESSVEEASRDLRSGKKPIHVSFVRENIPISRVNGEIWRRYEQALKSNGRQQFRTSDPTSEDSDLPSGTDDLAGGTGGLASEADLTGEAGDPRSKTGTPQAAPVTRNKDKKGKGATTASKGGGNGKGATTASKGGGNGKSATTASKGGRQKKGAKG